MCQKVVSKAEGRLVALASVTPSAEARRIADEHAKDPRHIEVILRETRRVVRRGHGVLICETRHGFVCANAGVDLSNAPGPEVAVLLPEDPDRSARELRAALAARGAGPLAVIVSDTFGRPWREGLVDVAIGSSGIAPIHDMTGHPDLAGRVLQVTATATVDQLAAAAGLLMRKDAGRPGRLDRGRDARGRRSRVRPVAAPGDRSVPVNAAPPRLHQRVDRAPERLDALPGLRRGDDAAVGRDAGLRRERSHAAGALRGAQLVGLGEHEQHRNARARRARRRSSASSSPQSRRRSWSRIAPRRRSRRSR